MLAAQREAMGLTVEQIADQLKLAPRQVVAIEQGDFASLPNMAVTRGFIRAYAKVVRLDPQPLVAQIEVTPAVAVPEHVPHKREKITTTFSESRFPSMTERQSKTKGWIVGGVVALVVIAAGGAWQAGLISPDLFNRPAATAQAPVVAAPATAPVQSPSVPLVSTPGETTVPATPDNTAPLVTAPATGTVAVPGATPGPATTATPAAAPATVTPPAAPAATVPAAAPTTTPAGANTLVLTVTEDSWIEIRRPGTTPLISRILKAGTTETVEIDRQSTLVVGKPDGVKATLRGEPVALPKIANGTISRVQIK